VSYVWLGNDEPTPEQRRVFEARARGNERQALLAEVENLRRGLRKITRLRGWKHETARAIARDTLRTAKPNG
jgi:hypothetical protein